MKIKTSNTRLVYNKIILFCLFMLLGFKVIIAQKSPWISAEVKASSIYYSTNVSEYKFNPGVSILIAENLGRSKISFGFEYTIFYLNYSYITDSDNHLINTEFNTVYLNFPILYTYKFHVSSKIDIGVFGGMSYSIPHKSIAVSYYDNREPLEEDLIKLNTSKKRLNFKSGVNLYYHLNKRLDIFGNLYTDFNIINNDSYYRHSYAPSSSAIGLGIGIEYNWEPLKPKK
ncbi:MAG: porin family protein [Chlorobi bacterium]|nr:porin family protein [Chlorobiota bacterium]